LQLQKVNHQKTPISKKTPQQQQQPTHSLLTQTDPASDTTNTMWEWQAVAGTGEEVLKKKKKKKKKARSSPPNEFVSFNLCQNPPANGTKFVHPPRTRYIGPYGGNTVACWKALDLEPVTEIHGFEILSSGDAGNGVADADALGVSDGAADNEPVQSWVSGPIVRVSDTDADAVEVR
jgi:hypothetical protein